MKLNVNVLRSQVHQLTAMPRASFLCFATLWLAIHSAAESSSSAIAADDNGNVAIAIDVESAQDVIDDAVADTFEDDIRAHEEEDAGETSADNSQEEILIETNIITDDTNINTNNQDELQYTPPTHFQITAHIQTDLHTGYSYFLPSESLPMSFAHLPFLECGAIGSTTESLPLVSGVFRHVPHTAVVPKREDIMDAVVLENLEGIVETGETMKGGGEDEALDDKLSGLNDVLDNESDKKNETETIDQESSDNNNNGNGDESIDDSNSDEESHPKRPSPPKYVVALSPMEITVGGGDGKNETQKFNAGDVIFIEDTWWIDYLDLRNDLNHQNDEESDIRKDSMNDAEEGSRMKGYIMRASPESNSDLNTLMLTVPNAVHRHWKNAQYAMAVARRAEQLQQRESEAESSQTTSSSYRNAQHEFGTRNPWWKRPTSFLKKPNSNNLQQQQQQQQQQQGLPGSATLLPKPCSLEADPAFADPSKASTTLSQHFTQHFTSLLKRSSNPHPSFLPHHHQDLLLPILAQTVAAAIGGATSLALVLQLWRIIPGPIAVGFGSACLIGAGTWGFVWLGEEILDQWELWRERRRLEKMMSDGWGRGGGSTVDDDSES